MRKLISSLFLGLTLFFSCTNGAEKQINTLSAGPLSVPPADTISAQVSIVDLNCWVEQERFFVAGICDNLSSDWQKIWLKMSPLDAAGNPLTINGEASASLATFSEAVPPRGRTSFFAEWSLKTFSGTPDSCIISGNGAQVLAAGPILVTGEYSGVRALYPEQVGDSVISVEKAWHANLVIENPLNLVANHPRVAMLLYGTDNRLWFVTVLNPEDSLQRAYVSAERQGPMQPQEKRRLGAIITYDNLPSALKENKIGRVDFQPFESRQQ
ncbi:MAG: hypothetical protein KIS77_00750 [Saprospiraceae bacterium]|nr:hypothetical protein [Saprospiraceae bacterium]